MNFLTKYDDNCVDYVSRCILVGVHCVIGHPGVSGEGFSLFPPFVTLHACALVRFCASCWCLDGQVFIFTFW